MAQNVECMCNMALWRCLGTMFWMERHQYCGAVVQMSVTVNNSKIEFDNNAFVGNLYNRQQRNVHRSICNMSRFLPILTNFGSTCFQIWRILSRWETHWYVRKDGRVDGRTNLMGAFQVLCKRASNLHLQWIELESFIRCPISTWTKLYWLFVT